MSTDRLSPLAAHALTIGYAVPRRKTIIVAEDLFVDAALAMPKMRLSPVRC